MKPASFVILCASLASVATCDQIPRASSQKNNLASMRTIAVPITGKGSYNCYIADTPETQQLGLMNVTEDDLPTDRGMIFVFEQDRYLSFWMRNTIIPLDIAYIRSDGTIVKTYTMEPLNEEGYPSVEPARFVLEVRAGQFAQHGIGMGDHVEIPSSLLK